MNTEDSPNCDTVGGQLSLSNQAAICVDLWFSMAVAIRWCGWTGSFNERTMPWRGIDTQAYVSCYRNAADSIRAVNPYVILDWMTNAHGSPDGLRGGASTNCCPGDDYVDIIGIDYYDHYPWSQTKAGFDRTAAEPEASPVGTPSPSTGASCCRWASDVWCRRGCRQGEPRTSSGG